MEQPEETVGAGARAALTGRSVNAWYAAVTRNGDLRLYLDHLEIATGAAEQRSRAELSAGRPASELDRELQYALSAASVRNLSANVSVRLLTTLLRRGLLSADDALSFVRQVPDPRERAEGLTTLLAVLDPDDAEDVAGEALAAVSVVPDPFWRVGELGRLVPHLPRHMAGQAELVAMSVDDAYYRAVALVTVGRDLDEELQLTLADLHFHRKNIMATEYELGEVAELFRAEFAQRSTHAVAVLGEFLPVPIRSQYWRAETYASLADDSEEHLRSALSATGTVGGGTAFTAMARAACLHLAGTGRPDDAWALLREVVDPADRVVIECELAAVTGTGADVARAAAAGDPWQRLHAVRALLPVLDEPGRADAVAGIIGVAPDDVNTHVLAEGLVTVASYLSLSEWERAVLTEPLLADDDERMRVRGALAARGVTLGRGEALDLLDGIDDDTWFAEAVTAVVQRLTAAGQADEALRWAARAPFPHLRVALIATCARALPGAAAAAAIADARAVAGELIEPTAQARALLLLADALAGEERMAVLREAITAATTIERGNEPLRSGCIAAVTASLAGTGDIDGALDLAGAITDEHWLASALAAVAGHATAAHLPRVLAMTRSVRARRERGRALIAHVRRHAVLGSDLVTVHEGWRESLQTLALGTRAEFFYDVTGLFPVADVLGAPGALAGLVRTSRAVMRWWP
ncbi:hypothetical protein HH310_21280 [Actinoplanes sp. TBRC 11911]|uniref:hypothetical protein n=1 Tax=Actinoplanes sp. TBRC 11911 TaxID=2729386 RepID=UPI00145E6F9E|nr:hypothetical protein [Actinoplanes sp. TBRC 11911]NMO53706.1 hypothetical protein [Actinoplanes sp. TBRC 11911]